METPAPGTSFGTQLPAPGMSRQMKIGLGFGVVAFLVLIGLLVYFFVFRNRSSEKEEAEPEAEPEAEQEEDCPEGQELKDGVCKQAAPVSTDTCVLTDKTYEQGARCMSKSGGGGERKSADWCCSDYGRKQGYQWKMP